MSTLTDTGVRLIRRHPRRALRIGLVTSGVLGTIARAGTAKRYVGVAAMPAKRAATDRRVRRESYRAATDAAVAWRRAERVGFAEALNDRRVARGLRRASRHISRAATYSISPPPSHRLRNVVLLVAGAGVGGAAIVAARGATSTRSAPRTETTSSAPDEASSWYDGRAINSDELDQQGARPVAD